MAECREGALLARFNLGDVRGIAVAFDVLASPWPLTPSFPFFVEAALRDLARVSSGIESGIRSGDLIEVFAGAGVSRAVLTDPSGVQEVEIPVLPEGVLRTSAGDELGIHTMSWRKGKDPDSEWIQQLIPVNLLSPEESSIEPKPSIGGITTVPEREQEGFWGGARSELWPWFLATALFLMMLEWIVFHRR